MKNAEEKLHESNTAILQHVESATTDHIYKLLKADQEKSKLEEQQEEHVQKMMDLQAKAHEAKEHANTVLGINGEQAHALAAALKSTGVMPSASVMSGIEKILSESSHAASHSMSSALSHASHSSTGSSSHHSGSGSSHHSGSSHSGSSHSGSGSSHSGSSHSGSSHSGSGSSHSGSGSSHSGSSHSESSHSGSSSSHSGSSHF